MTTMPKTKLPNARLREYTLKDGKLKKQLGRSHTIGPNSTANIEAGPGRGLLRLNAAHTFVTITTEDHTPITIEVYSTETKKAHEFVAAINATAAALN